MSQLSKKLAVGAAAMAVAASLFASAGTASAYTTVTQDEDALATYDVDALSELDNSNAPAMVVTPKKYANQTTERKIHTFKTTAGNANYTFRTKLFLPTVIKGKRWSTIQSFEMVGKYLYEVVLDEKAKDKGFIARWDMDILSAGGIDGGSWALRDMRYGEYGAQKKALKQGPRITIGHGQSLAYNPADGMLYMWGNDQDSSAVYHELEQIDPNTMNITKVYKFKTIANNGKSATTSHNLVFDNDGHFYYEQIQQTPTPGTTSGAVKIYRGTIADEKVSIELLPQLIKNRPGTLGQSLGYNSATGDMYLVSDGAFTAFPIAKLAEGTLTADDLKYTVLNTKREMEGIDFDDNGDIYILLAQGPEIISTQAAAKTLVSPVPKIKGTVKVGKTVKAVGPYWNYPDAKVAYRWVLDGKVVSKNKSYKIPAKAAGKTLRLKIIGKKSGVKSATVATKAVTVKK
ncbi:MAG: hypothetical protein LBR32_06430 [Propionibacteriaceae bacterium]|jgi:hypothetical protein|nr:hypothetical protein [Propionibacteriaceae bacterium]